MRARTQGTRITSAIAISIIPNHNIGTAIALKMAGMPGQLRPYGRDVSALIANSHCNFSRPAVALSALTLLNFFTDPLAEEFGFCGICHFSIAAFSHIGHRHWAINSQLTLFAAFFPSLRQEQLPGGIAFALTSALAAGGLAYLWRDTR